MPIEIIEEQPPDWVAYGTVPIRFTARSVVEARRLATGGFELLEHPLAAPREKDYDAIAGEEPAAWAGRFDVSRWGVLVARADGARVGGAVVSPNARDGRALLRDLRVRPEWRGRGVGRALFRAAEGWVRRQGSHALEVETQDVNPAACRFYARMGCELLHVDPAAYPTLPGEVQLVWARRLDA